MLLSLHPNPFPSPFQDTQIKGKLGLTKTTFFPSLESLKRAEKGLQRGRRLITASTHGKVTTTQASMLETPVLWAGRICIFYALLKAGLVGSQQNPLVSETDDLGFSTWLDSFQGKSEEKEASDRRKLVSKWHPTTKGTLKRSYRVPSKSEGCRLLKAIASLLSDDDHFRDATSHKGCQIRRESAHGETVCCNNVRALFDELPTPHLVVEITAFPAGPLTEKDYTKAEKLEKVLRLFIYRGRRIHERARVTFAHIRRGTQPQSLSRVISNLIAKFEQGPLKNESLQKYKLRYSW